MKCKYCGVEVFKAIYMGQELLCESRSKGEFTNNRKLICHICDYEKMEMMK